MKLKLYKKSPIIRNSIMLVFLNIIFFHIYISLSTGASSLNIGSFIFTLSHNKLLTLISIVALISLIGLKKFAMPIFASYLLFTGANLLWTYAESNDKLLLLMSFIYILLMFFSLILLFLELRSAVYHPLYFYNSLDKRAAFKVEATAQFPSGKECDGYLTNWDGTSCFVRLYEFYNEPGIVKLIVKFDDLTFFQEGFVFTGYDSGLGIKFKMTHKKQYSFSWLDFFQVARDRGFDPQNT